MAVPDGVKHSAGRVTQESGLIEPEFWTPFNTNNVNANPSMEKKMRTRE